MNPFDNLVGDRSGRIVKAIKQGKPGRGSYHGSTWRALPSVPLNLTFPEGAWVDIFAFKDNTALILPTVAQLMEACNSLKEA